MLITALILIWYTVLALVVLLGLPYALYQFHLALYPVDPDAHP
jgi:hypothetical protein